MTHPMIKVIRSASSDRADCVEIGTEFNGRGAVALSLYVDTFGDDGKTDGFAREYLYLNRYGVEKLRDHLTALLVQS